MGAAELERNLPNFRTNGRHRTAAVGSLNLRVRGLLPNVGCTQLKMKGGNWRRGGIRTGGRVSPTPVFKTGAINHFATHRRETVCADLSCTVVA